MRFVDHSVDSLPSVALAPGGCPPSPQPLLSEHPLNMRPPCALWASRPLPLESIGFYRTVTSANHTEGASKGDITVILTNAPLFATIAVSSVSAQSPACRRMPGAVLLPPSPSVESSQRATMGSGRGGGAAPSAGLH